MRSLRFFLRALLVLLILALGAVIAIPILYKKDIVQHVKEDLNQELNAVLHFDEDISISLFQRFPNLTVDVHDFVLVGKDEFANDTLFTAENIRATVDLGQLIHKNRVEIEYLQSNKASLQLITTGTNDNWDIFKASQNSSETVYFSSGFDRLLLQDARFSYTDTSEETVVVLDGITGTFSGDLTSDNFDLNSSLTCADALVEHERIPYVNRIPLTVDAVTSIDLANDEYRFKENSVYVGDMLFTGEGGMLYDHDSIVFDLSYASKNSSFKELMSLIPGYYKQELQGMEASGNTSIKGSVIGTLSEASFPAYDFFLDLSNGVLSHPSLESDFTDVDIDLEVQNSDGQDNSLVVDFKRLNLTHLNQPLQASLYLKNLYVDPYARGRVIGQLSLADLSRILLTQSQSKISGLINCDVEFDGFYSSIENEAYESFNSKGAIEGRRIQVRVPDYPQLDLTKAELDFTSTHMSIPLISGSVDSTDFALNGEFENFFGYLFDQETLSGEATFSSSYFDADRWAAPETEVSDTSTNLIITVPPNLDLALVYNLGAIKLAGSTFTNVVGNSQMVDESLKINQLTTEFWGGRLSFNGYYNTTDPNRPLADLHMTVQDLDVTEAFKLTTVKALAPVAEYVRGKFSSTFHIKTNLLRNMTPDLKNITCQGVIDLFDCDVKGLKTFNELAAALSYDEYQKPVTIKDLLLSFRVIDGKVEVQPFELPVGETSFNLGGYSTLAKTLHYDGLLIVPKKLYLQKKDHLNSYIPTTQLNRLDSLDFKNLELALAVTGAFAKPKLEIAYKKMAGGIKEQVKSRAQQELEKQKEELKKKAEKELERARKEAEEAKKEAERKAREALEEQKRKIEEQIKKETDSTRIILEKELKKKRDELFKKHFPPIGN